MDMWIAGHLVIWQEGMALGIKEVVVENPKHTHDGWNLGEEGGDRKRRRERRKKRRNEGEGRSSEEGEGLEGNFACMQVNLYSHSSPMG